MIIIKNPVEVSFYLLISMGYPFDEDSFYTFVKTVCKYPATKWKDTDYLKKRILEKMPGLADDQEYLEERLLLFEHLVYFHKTRPLRTPDHRKVKSGYYIEQFIKNDKIQERELPLP